jgi:ABC-type transporter MlaC component
VGAFLGVTAIAGAAFGEEAVDFVQNGQTVVTGHLKQPKSEGRESNIRNHLASIIDYDEMTRRAFRDHWSKDLSGDQQTEVSGLLRQLIERNYRCNLQKTLNYTVSFKGQRDVNGEWRVRTDAQNAQNSREPPVRVEYMVREVNGRKWLVDIITENSSLIRNYGDQFDLMLSRPDQGFDYLVRKLQRKINSTSC